MQFYIPHSVTYQFDGKATVREIADSLVAQERLLKDAVRVLEHAFPNLTVESVRVDVRLVVQESPLKETLSALIVGAYATELGEDVPDILNTLFGIDVPDQYDSVVSVLVLIIALYGIDWVRKKLFPGQSSEEIDKEKVRLLKKVAERANISQEHLEEAIDEAIGKKRRSVIKSAVEFLRPAKRHKASSVEVGAEPGHADESIGAGAIAEMPSDLDLEAYEPPMTTERIDNVEVKFRRHDLDKQTGWAGTIEALSTDRKQLHLAPHIDGKNLFELASVRANVIVTSIRTNDGEYEPSLYYLAEVLGDDAT